MQGGAVGEVIESRAEGVAVGDMVQHMFGWRDATVVQAYSAFQLPIEKIVAKTGPSVTWHYCRPPIAELEFEMDVRGVSVERVL